VVGRQTKQTHHAKENGIMTIKKQVWIVSDLLKNNKSYFHSSSL